jgi:hypothetical protein
VRRLKYESYVEKALALFHFSSSCGCLLGSALLAGLMRINLAMGELSLCAAARAVTAGLATLLACLSWVDLALSEFWIFVISIDSSEIR